MRPRRPYAARRRRSWDQIARWNGRPQAHLERRKRVIRRAASVALSVVVILVVLALAC